jgi:hypothetical protein
VKVFNNCSLSCLGWSKSASGSTKWLYSKVCKVIKILYLWLRTCAFSCYCRWILVHSITGDHAGLLRVKVKIALIHWYIDIFCFSLPKSVKRRIKALKNLQVSCCKLEGNFYEEVHALECKYSEKFKPLYEKVQSSIHVD